MKKFFTVFALLFSTTFAGAALAEEPVAAPTTQGFVEVGLGLGGCQGDCDNVDPSVGISLAQV